LTISGTREWATSSYNIQTGCPHGCLYCYAFAQALRFGRVKNYKEWTCPLLDVRKFNKKFRKRKGRIMFPTTHDITPENVEECLKVLKSMLSAGNDVLIVSKPHLDCIQRLCEELVNYQNQILFRFTIGSKNDGVLKFWEPGAPCFEERKAALEYAFNLGYGTSVSCEPYLDSSVTEVVRQVTPYVTDAVWIGKMNRIEQRVDMTGWSGKEFAYLIVVRTSQSDSAVIKLAAALKGNPKIKWKESIKKVLGIPLATEAGRDE
jgi:DNA repair photolyase